MKNTDPTEKADAPEAGWQGLYRVAGAGALISVIFVLLDIVLSFAGWDVETGSLSAAGWFAQFQNNVFLGLRNFGLFNVFNTTLTIPLYLALYRLQRRTAPAFAALALVLVLIGAAVYAANNQALSMLALSREYASATTQAQKSLLESAGTVLLAQGEDFTPGTFFGLFFSGAGSFLMMVVMLGSGVVRKATAITGLVGSGCLLAFTISATFLPATFDLAMLVALVGGLLMLAWDIVMVLFMFRISRESLWQNKRLDSQLESALQS